MPKKHSQREAYIQQQKRRQSWIITLVLVGICLVLFIAIGYDSHARCTQNCQSQPVYFYGIQIPGAHYSQFYNTDENGHSLQNSSDENNSAGHSSNNGDEENGSHSSSSSEDGGYHGGGFHGGGEP